MQSALRPYVTAGVALVGASAIAVTPVTVPPPAVEEVRDAAVELSALVNPVQVFGQIFEDAVQQAQTVGQTIADNPAPILEQVLANQLGNIGSIGAGLEAQIGVIPELPALLGDALASQLGTVGNLALLGQTFIENAVEVLTSTDPGSLRAQIQDAIDLIDQGEFGLAFGNLAVLPLLPLLGPGLSNIILLPQLISALQQPFADAATLLPIAEGPLANVQNAIGVLGDINTVLPLGLGALLALNGTATAAGNTLGELIGAVQNGDPEAAFNAIVNGSAAASTALLNGALDPDFGLVAGLQGLREAIATAITPPAVESADSLSKVPSGAAKSFTLTAPLKEITASPKAGATSEEEAASPVAGDASGTTTESTKDTSNDATPAVTKDSAKGGNLFTPGSSSSKGGRHRADAGSFAQGVRDTIKGLTGLGREKKSDKETSGASASKSSESGSSSSGSGDSGSGGDSGSK